MKTVFPTRNVAHVFANETQDNGRNPQGNFYFNGRVIYSYRDSWPLCVLTPFQGANGKRVAIFNGCSYSVTTSRHASHVRDALRGLPFNVVSVPSSFDSYDARALENGNAQPLAKMAASLATEARAEFSQAIRKRCEHRAAWLLDSAARNYANAGALVALIPGAADKRKARAEVGTLPAAFPLAWRDDSGNPLADLIATLGDARRAQAATEARETMKRAVSNARGFWKEARSDSNSAEIRRIRAKSAISELRSAAIFAKRCAMKLPRGLPSIATVNAYRDKLEPLEMAQRFESNTRRVIFARTTATENYFSSVRALRNGTSRAPDQLRRALGDTRNARSVSKVCQEARRVVNRSHPEAFQPDASGHAVKIVRDAYNALHAECVATLAALEPLELRVERMANRELLESAQAQANEDAHNATDNVTTLGFMIKRITEAEELRAANPNLARGIAVNYSGQDVKAIRERFALATYGNRVAAFETATGRAEELAAQAAQADARTVYAANRAADSARLALQNARDIAGIMATLRQDADITETEATRALLATLPELAARVEAATAHVATLEVDSIRAWRNRDKFAPVPASTVFRLSACGQEIESSRGARVSIAAGARLWRMIRAAVDSGTGATWAHGEGPAVGSFRALAINADGSAIIGCHTITATEARAFARFMEWPPFDVARAA